jgi:hypothetical protein
MDRRNISKILLGSAAGAGLLGEHAQAQGCVSPCYAQPPVEAAASVTPVDTLICLGMLDATVQLVTALPTTPPPSKTPFCDQHDAEVRWEDCPQHHDEQARHRSRRGRRFDLDLVDGVTTHTPV